MGSIPKKISASRGAAVLGVSKYKTPLVAWLEIMEAKSPGFCEKNGHKIPERIDPFAEPLDPKTAAMRWGLSFEDTICDMVGGITDRERAYTYGKYTTCHIDGRKNGMLQENKTANIRSFQSAWGEPGTDEIPIEYSIQLQHQMKCTGDKEAELNLLVFPESTTVFEKNGFDLKTMNKREFAESIRNLGFFHTYKIKADKQAQKDIMKRYRIFWNKNVLKGIAPDVNEFDDIKWLIPSPSGELEATEELVELWIEYNDIGVEIKDQQARLKELKTEFVKFIANGVPKEAAEKGILRVYNGSNNIMSHGKKFTVGKPKGV